MNSKTTYFQATETTTSTTTVLLAEPGALHSLYKVGLSNVWEGTYDKALVTGMGQSAAKAQGKTLVRVWSSRGGLFADLA